MLGLPTDRFVARFLERIEVREDGCWEWQGHRDKRYGRFYAGDTEERWVHRLAWRLAYGEPVPDGLTIDHLCFNTFCVNVTHMEVVTQAENTRRWNLRRPKLGHGTEACWARGCRCDGCAGAASEAHSKRRRLKRGAFARGEMEIRHGTTYGYGLGCKCAECSTYALAKAEAYKRSKGIKPFKPAEHGTTSMYTKYKCRCDACRECWSEYWKAYRRNKREAVAS